MSAPTAEEPARPHCFKCGRRLSARRFRPGRFGYRGNGRFCTMACGYEYGQSFAHVVEQDATEPGSYLSRLTIVDYHDALRYYLHDESDVAPEQAGAA